MSDRPITLLLVDDDSIFRLGLVTVLSCYSDFAAIAQADDTTTVLAALATQVIDIVILELNLLDNALMGWELCQQIKKSYPDCKIFLFSRFFNPSQLTEIQNLGVEGYALKGLSIKELVEQLRQIADGQIVWQAVESANLIQSGNIQSKSWLLSVHESGITQIEEQIAQIQTYLERPQLSWWDWFFWSGRKRELLAARWAIAQLLPVEKVFVYPQTPSAIPSLLPRVSQNSAEMTLFSQSSNRLEIYNQTLARIEADANNLTPISLEIDILRFDKKQELLKIVLDRWIEALENLRFIEVVAEQLPNNRDLILAKIERESCLSFLGKYCFAKEEFNLETIENIINHEEPLIEREVLDKIPLVSELLQDLLFKQNWIANQVIYPPSLAEELSGEIPLFHNTIIQIANGVMSLVLNQFSDLETVRQQLFHQKLMSSREIARFRNNLSWRYRQEFYWEEPRNIFESKYRLFFFSPNGIQLTDVYVPRQAELQQLTGIRWAVTILLETHDAVAPLLRSLVGFVGNGVVYVLTQVIGRGIGLIGRGIFQGLGNTLQNTRYGKNRRKRDL